MKTILFLCPVHKRHQYLEAAARQFAAIPGYYKAISYFQDRCTDEVLHEIADIRKLLGDPYQREGVSFNCYQMPFPIMKDAYGNFPLAWDYMLKEAVYLPLLIRDVNRSRPNDPYSQPPIPDFVGIWDDDMILSHPEKVPEILENADLVYGPKLFLWDSVEQYNTRLEHNSVVFWRFREGDEFHTKAELQVHAPKGVHDDPQSRKCQLEDFILDFGFMTEIDRIMVFEREVKTGKIDGFTRPLVEEPKLKTLPDDLLEISRRVSKYFKA